MGSHSYQNQQVRHGGSIKVILLQDLENKGLQGEIVNVKRGYARNLLIPRKLAIYDTMENRGKYKGGVENAIGIWSKHGGLAELANEKLVFERLTAPGN